MTPDIDLNFNKTVQVLRLDADESGDGEQYATHLVNIPCHIQPLTEAFDEDLTGNFGKDWLMFCESMDIVEGDRIVEGTDDSGSIESSATIYQVTAVERYEFLGQDRHMEVRIRKNNG